MSIGSMDKAYFVSRVELLAWVNGTVGPAAGGAVEYKKVEDCCTALPYLQMYSQVFPGSGVNAAAKAKQNPRGEYECSQNWKILQDALAKGGCSRMVEIEKLAKGNYQLNLEFLQWFKKLHETKTQGDFGATPPPNFGAQSPPPAAAIGARATPKTATAAGRTPGRATPGTGPARPAVASAPSGAAGSHRASNVSATSAASASSASAVRPRAQAQAGASTRPVSASRTGGAAAGGAAVNNASMASAASAGAVSAQQEDEKHALLELERRFYYDKLRDIELLVTNATEVEGAGTPEELAKMVRHLLYKS